MNRYRMPPREYRVSLLELLDRPLPEPLLLSDLFDLFDLLDLFDLKERLDLLDLLDPPDLPDRDDLNDRLEPDLLLLREPLRFDLGDCERLDRLGLRSEPLNLSSWIN